MVKSKVILKSKKAITIIYKKYDLIEDYVQDMCILRGQVSLLWDTLEMYSYNVDKKKYVLFSKFGELY